MPFSSCLEVSSGLIDLDLVGCTGAVFCPGPNVVVVGLDPELGPDLLPVVHSGCFLVCTRCLVHSLAIVEVTVFLVAVGKVAVLEVVVAKVESTRDAIIIVATPPEVVDVKVNSSSQLTSLNSKRLRLERTEPY